MKLSLINDSLTTPKGARETLLKWLLSAVEYVGGSPAARIVPNVLSADPAFAREILRARAVQNAGYEMSFGFENRFPDSPHIYICSGQFMDDTQHAAGFDFFSRSHAFIKALSETLERRLWAFSPSYWNIDAFKNSTRDISKPFLKIDALAGFSDIQRKSGSRLSFDDTTPFLWTKGVRLSTGKPIWVPSQMVSARYVKEMKESEPLLLQSTTNGLATHATFEKAACAGLLELIERDAFMITFFNQISPPRVDPDSIHDERVRSLLELFSRFNYSCDIVLLPTDMPVTVVCVVLRDETGVGPALAVGAKAHHDPVEAVRGALAESYIVSHSMRRAGIYQKPVPPLPWNMFQRLAFWGKKENAEKLSWLWRGPLVPLPKTPKDSLTLRELAQAVEEKGSTSAAVLMSPPSLQKLDLYSVCVVSPLLQPLNLDSDPPYLGGARLKSVPESLGYKSKDAPPPYPHPFP
jgi:ribosomal protein S12 methylthiotransferase accessory factor